MSFESLEKKIYFAPMEGITGAIYRRTHSQFFEGVDEYYTPFLAVNHTHKFKRREKREFVPNENPVPPIPQILTNDAEDFIWAAKELSKYGYNEINLNMGCPAATVFNKHKGAGMLADLPRLKTFFDVVFAEKSPEMEISIKTRVGISSEDGLEEFIDLWNSYPFKMTIVHPRVRDDYYKGKLRLDAFKKCVALCRVPLVFNGNICNREDYKEVVEKFPQISAVMIGRGLLKNPALAREIKGGEKLNRLELKAFYEKLLQEYRDAFTNEREVLFCMKELWSYSSTLFGEGRKLLQKIQRSKSLEEYMGYVDSAFIGGFGQSFVK